MSPKTLPNGIYAMTLTPMFDDLRRRQINWDALLKQIDWCAEQHIEGLVIAPSIGEAPHLREEERLEVFRVSIERVRYYHSFRKMKMIAMTSHCDTDQVVDFANKARVLGYDAQQVTPPYYWPIGKEGLIEHYKIAWEESGLPIILYHNPGLSGVTMSTSLIQKILSEVPEGIIGIKETETDLYKRLIPLKHAVAGRVPIYNTFRALGWGLQHGAAGGFINVPTLPASLIIARLFAAGLMQEMLEFQEKITTAFPQKGEHDEDAIVLTKAMASIVTGIEMGPVRRPYPLISADFVEDFKKKYEELMANAPHLPQGSVS